jgi:hypothetical protein
MCSLRGATQNFICHWSSPVTGLNAQNFPIVCHSSRSTQYRHLLLWSAPDMFMKNTTATIFTAWNKAVTYQGVNIPLWKLHANKITVHGLEHPSIRETPMAELGGLHGEGGDQAVEWEVWRQSINQANTRKSGFQNKPTYTKT